MTIYERSSSVLRRVLVIGGISFAKIYEDRHGEERLNGRMLAEMRRRYNKSKHECVPLNSLVLFKGIESSLAHVCQFCVATPTKAPHFARNRVLGHLCLHLELHR
jgi:hypothetical protein